MTYDPKEDLLGYLRQGREAMMWKLEGLSEHDVRRPLTATGTNLLGLVKHLAGVEAGYLGEVFDRPFPEALEWMDERAEANADMWATDQEPRAEVVDLYRRVWAHGDATIAALPLDAVGYVPWWTPQSSRPTLHRILVHVIAETHRHAGHGDVVRELVDGQAGHQASNSNLPDQDGIWWTAYRDRVQAVADTFA